MNYESLIPSILGIIGTILGVILGWILKLLSTKGKLKFYNNSTLLYISKSDSYGGFQDQEKIDELTESVTLNIQFDLYNSSNEQVIIRDLAFFIIHKHSEIKRSLMVIENNGSILGPQSKEIKNINIPPKTILSFNPRVYFEKNDFEKLRTSEFQIRYRDRRNRTKSIRINHNWP